MGTNKTVLFLSGKIYWAKILGEPRMNYQKTGREWTLDLELNEASLAEFLKTGLRDRVKGKGFNLGLNDKFADRAPFISLKKTELRSNGAPNTPIRVYDANNNRWEDPEQLIGNGSEVDVRVEVVDYGPGRKKGVYPAAVRVQKLVKVNMADFPKDNSPSNNDALDDDIPF